MTEVDLQSKKAELRLRFRERRQQLTGDLRLSHEQSIRQRLMIEPRLTAAARIGAYLAFDGEPDLMPLLGSVAKVGVLLGLPNIDKRLDHQLQFLPWDPSKPLAQNQWGIREPVEGNPIPICSFDLLLIPLVAWDRQGGRLGMGGGFYDRALARCPEDSGPFRLGVAFGIQQADSLPTDPWDAKLDAVLTEQAWYDIPTEP